MLKRFLGLTCHPIFQPLLLGAVLLPIVTPLAEARPVVLKQPAIGVPRSSSMTTQIYGSPIQSPVPIPSNRGIWNSGDSYEYDQDYSWNRRVRRGGTIRNSTLINPTIIDSEIEDSVLIDPVIIDSSINRRYPRRGSYGYYGSSDGDLRIRVGY